MSLVTSLSNGTLLHGRYHIDQMLGAGGFGITYRATDTILERTVAIKELYPHALYPVSRAQADLVVPASQQDDHRKRVQRVLKEGLVFTGFRHPNLVRIYEAFVANNTAYLVMAFLDGESLRSLLDKHETLAPSIVTDLLQHIGTGLAYLHERGVLHLDVKPDNIFVMEGTYILIDYGEAKAADEGLSVQMSTGGYTPAYMAMEQYGAGLEKGPYTDIYALGVAAYECLTGTLPPGCVERQFGQEVDLSGIEEPTLRHRLEHALAVMPEDRPETVRRWLHTNVKVTTPEPSAVTIALPNVSEKTQGRFPVRQDSKYGYIDETGNLVIKPQFDEVASFSEELAGVKHNGKWGYIDKNGRVVIEPQFNRAGPFAEGLARAEHNNKWGYIDKTWRFVIEPPFGDVLSFAERFSEGLARAKYNGKWGYIDKTGRVVIEPNFDWAWSFAEGLARIEHNGKWGYIDKNGRVVIEPQFDSARDFVAELANVKHNGKWGYIDETGRFVIEPQFDAAGDFAEGLACVAHDDTYGYIDKRGRIIIEPHFVYAGAFAEGLAHVQDERGYYGYIDTTGQIVIEPFLDGAGRFKDGLAFVTFQGWNAYLNKTGHLIWRES